MAKKTTSIVKSEVAVPALPMEQWEQDLAKEARDERAKETLGVARITHKAGMLRTDGKPVPGNTLKLAIIDYCAAKSFYEGSYVEGKAATPSCYAFGPEQGGMVPHPASPKRQAESCDSCKHNVFGTALMANGQPGGAGKRCKDERRLMVVISNDDPKAINSAEVRQLSVPPSSLKAWGQYLSSVLDITPLGVRGVVTEVGTAPLKSSYGLTFKAVDRLTKEFVQALMTRRESVKGLMTAPYPTLTVEEPAAPVDTKKNAARARKIG